MNKSTRILLLLVIVAAAAYYLISKQPWRTSNISRKDFAVEDTASVTRVFIADRKGHTVLLKKQDNGTWLVNDKEQADLQKVMLLKETLHDVEIRNPIPEKEFNTVVSNLATYGTKVEIYQGEDLIKTFYIGESTPDGTGTYMIIEGSSSPYITHIPGFVGYLTPRFLPNPLKWKSKKVFDVKPEEISTVSVEYPSHPEQSFSITQGNPALVMDHHQQVIPSDPNFTAYYLGSFHDLYLEAYSDEVTAHEQDSIAHLTPYCIITVVSKNKQQRRLRVIMKAIDDRTKERYDEVGNEFSIDHDKYFAFVDDEKELAFIQQYNFGRLFHHLDEFRRH